LFSDDVKGPTPLASLSLIITPGSLHHLPGFVLVVTGAIPAAMVIALLVVKDFVDFLAVKDFVDCLADLANFDLLLQQRYQYQLLIFHLVHQNFHHPMVNVRSIVMQFSEL